MASPTWVVDTSSRIAIRSLFSCSDRVTVMEGLTTLLTAARLMFPREVVAELERYAGPENPARVPSMSIKTMLKFESIVEFQ